MITPFDDYCIHQTCMPIAHPAQSDRNHYDRYWFNGAHREGDYFFEVGFGLYPNRYVMDGHFSVVVNGEQYSFHGSCRCPADRTRTQIGPMVLKVEEPMRKVRVSIANNDTGIACDLLFVASTAPSEEPQNILYEDGSRNIMHNSRFTQFGTWSGWFSVDGKRTEVKAELTPATRDKSWGVRPVGEPAGGAPALSAPEPRVYWVWSPINFGDITTQFGSFEDSEGVATQLSGCVVPTYSNIKEIPDQESGHREMSDIRHQIDWLKDTRRPKGITIQFRDTEGKEQEISAKTVMRFYMRGIGYQHPEWGHAMWQGEEKIERESWKIADVSPLEFSFIHVHSLIHAKMGKRTGVGVVETMVLGAHKPSGFKEFLDGAA